MSPSEALGCTAPALLDRHVESPQSRAALVRLLPKLGRYLESARGVCDIADVTGDDVLAWIAAPFPDGRRPSLATQHHRRALVRLAFRLLRTAGYVDHDPSLDVDLPPRTSRSSMRPLRDNEVERGRAAALRTLGETRLPAVWALAEATATTHEIPRIRPSDVRLDDGVVLLSGSRSTLPREGRLTDWGVSTLAARMQTTGNTPLAYRGAGQSPAAMQASCSAALDKILTAAGLRADKSVKPVSVRAWAGHRVWQTTGRIEAAAAALGCRSLDAAAATIGLDWQPQP
jgi:integrase